MAAPTAAAPTPHDISDTGADGLLANGLASASRTNEQAARFKTRLWELVTRTVPGCLRWIREKQSSDSQLETIPTTDMQLVQSLCFLLSALLDNPVSQTAHGPCARDALSFFEKRRRAARRAGRSDEDDEDEQEDSGGRKSRKGDMGMGMGMVPPMQADTGMGAAHEPVFALLAALPEREWHAFLAPVFAFTLAWGLGSTLSTEQAR